MKVCIDCKSAKPLDAFPPRKDSDDGRRNQCRNCYDEKRRDNYIKNGRVKTNHYSHLGLSREEYLDIREKRGEAECEICGREDNLHIDHDHSTGQLRGFLCHWCNTGIGLLQEDPSLLAESIKYLIRYS